MRWTRARLQRMLSLRFGFNSAGGVNTRAVAAAMGVSQRSVQRWLHADSGRSLAHIPPGRLEHLLELVSVDPVVVAREKRATAYAYEAVRRVERGRGVLPAWRKRRWLEAHRVTVLEIPVRQLKIRQVALARDEPQRMQIVHRRGQVVEELVVPTRFHATVLANAVLDRVGPWRFQAGSDQVAQAFTQAWLADRTTKTVGLEQVLREVFPAG